MRGAVCMFWCVVMKKKTEKGSKKGRLSGEKERDQQFARVRMDKIMEEI